MSESQLLPTNKMSKFSSIVKDHEIKLFVILAIILSILLGLSFLYESPAKRDSHSVPTEVVISHPFSAVLLKAKAVYVYDVRNKTVLFAKNEDASLPLASLAKLMSALVAKELGPLHSTVTVSAKALEIGNNNGLREDEKWSLENLLDYSLVTSSNAGMRAVALSLGALSRANVTSEEIIEDFVREMNRKAGVLGLEHTYFDNETGLDISLTSTPVDEADKSEIKGGAYGSAEDMVKLLEYILINSPELFAITREPSVVLESIDGHAHVAKNTNSMISEVPGLLISKTGFTTSAGGNLAIIFDPELGRPIIISILGSTEQGRFEDMRKLVTAVMEYIKTN